MTKKFKKALLAAGAAAWFSTLVNASAGPASLNDSLAAPIVRKVAPQVERLRGLSFKRPVPVNVVDAQAAREHLVQRLEAFQQMEHLRQIQKAYAMLDLIPAELDLWEAILDVLEEQAAGFYDPATGSYYLVEHMPAAAVPMLTAHELTHALEDQHYDLDARIRASLEDDDRLFALSAVHEGSATLLMLAYAMAEAMGGSLGMDELQEFAILGQDQTQALSALPPLLLRQLVGPYVLGAQFLLHGGKPGAFPAEAVNRAYLDGPRSSEQILHPEKYWEPERRDDPLTLEHSRAGQLLGPRWHRAGTGVLGELSLAVLVGAPTPTEPSALLSGSPEEWTNAAASGWGGDRWELWVKGRSAVVLLRTLWDSAQDALEFAQALPRREQMQVQVDGTRVTIVAARAGRKSARLLHKLLPSSALEPASLVPTGRTR